jgi:hypothetical protein
MGYPEVTYSQFGHYGPDYGQQSIYPNTGYEGEIKDSQGNGQGLSA